MTKLDFSSGGAVRLTSRAVGRPLPSIDDDLDFTGVDPLRLQEIKRRVAVVRKFLAEPVTSPMARRRSATKLGLSVNQFLALVRAWREHGRAVALSCAGAARGAPRAEVPRSLAKRAKDAAREVILSLDPDLPHVVVIRAVEKRCATLNVRAPSRSWIWDRIMATRQNAPNTSGAGSIIVSRCHVRIPVEKNGSITYPWIVIAVDGSSGAVLAAAMGGKHEALDVISAGIAPYAGGRELLIDAEFAALAVTVDPSTVRVVKSSAARTATAKVLGRGFGSIQLVYQVGRSVAPERLLRSRKDQPLLRDEARRLILNQLAIHNSARGTPSPDLSWNN